MVYTKHKRNEGTEPRIISDLPIHWRIKGSVNPCKVRAN